MTIMRKVDYAALADIIRRATSADTVLRMGYSQLEERARNKFAQHIAREFAGRASVDRAEFLKACGIDP